MRWRVARLTRYAHASVIDVVGCERENRYVRAHFLTPCEEIDRLPSADAPRVVRLRRWRRLACGILGQAAPAYGSLRAAAAADLAIMPFQLAPALAVKRGQGCSLLIADAVGLGKTVQAALIIAEVLERGPEECRAIVVCPAGLREQWRFELRTRFRLDAAILDSLSIAAAASGSLDANPWAMHPVVVASIDFVKRPEVLRSLETIVWDVGVFDEAHALAGRSDRHTAAAELADRCRTAVLLSATPHSGDEQAFERLTSIGRMGGRFPTLVFRRTREDAGLSLPRRTRWCLVRPSDAERRMHERLTTYARLAWSRSADRDAGASLAVGVLIRRACSSAASLARSIDRRIVLLSEPVARSIPPDGGHHTAFAQERTAHHQFGLPFSPDASGDEEPAAELGLPALADTAREIAILTELRDMAVAASTRESKIHALERLLRRLRQPALVFTEYRDTLVRLQDALAPFNPVCLHGGLTARERREVVRAFTDGSAPLLLATDAASEGLNLQHRCRIVVHLELPWTPLRLEQRVGRVDRIGQARPVHSISLIARGTSEETTVARLWHRIRRADDVLDAMRGMTPEVPSSSSADSDGLETMQHLPPGLVVPAIDAAARAEADRLEVTRRLLARASNAPESRPAVTTVRRGIAAPSACCVFRVEYQDSRHHIVTDALLGLHAARAGRRPHTAAEARAWFADLQRAVERHMRREQAGLLATLIEEMRPVLETASTRERAIVEMIGARRARMAAGLIQPGLFDRRSERSSAAQAAVLDEALARASRRLDALAALERVSIARCAPAIAIVIG